MKPLLGFLFLTAAIKVQIDASHLSNLDPGCGRVELTSYEGIDLNGTWYEVKIRSNEREKCTIRGQFVFVRDNSGIYSELIVNDSFKSS